MSRDPIVTGTDGEPRAELAVDKAGELAQALGAPVHVVCVPSGIYGQDWPAAITAEQFVDTAADRLRGRGITVQTHIPKGHKGEEALELVAVAQRENAQMIVVGNKGMTGVRRLLGSLPNLVSHQAQCHILIVPTESHSLGELGGGSIVVGIDASSGAMRALKEAIRLSKALDSELHIVSVSKPPDSPDSILAAAVAQAADEGVDATAHALHGDPADGLLGVAHKNDAAIIVVGSKGMRSGKRERIGNIPDRVSHKASSSVLIVFTEDANGADSETMTAGGAEDAGSTAKGTST